MAGFTIGEILSELSFDKDAWVVANLEGDEPIFVTIPDARYPGKKPVRFFLSEHDCDVMIDALVKAHGTAKTGKLCAVKVPLIYSMMMIASADSYVVHGPNEVFDFQSLD